MLSRKPTGRAASALKYDILTAMGSYALAQPKAQQVLILRLLTLVTARYNWQRDELAVGQREIARLWHVEERTVKRDLAKLRAARWLVVKRQGARGRVSEYSLNIEQILRDSETVWEAVGPDYAHRMRGEGDQPQSGNVVPLAPHQVQQLAPPPPDAGDGSEWTLARAVLHADDPATYASWLMGLERVGRAGGRLVLRAPSRFHANYVMSHLNNRLLAACREIDEGVNSISVES